MLVRQGHWWEDQDIEKVKYWLGKDIGIMRTLVG